MNSEIRREMRKRDRLFKKWKQNPAPHYRTKFTEQRNNVINLIRRAKVEYFTKLESKIENTKVSSKEWWKICKNLYKGSHGDPSSIPPLQTANNEYVYTDIDKANELNTFFTSITQLNEDHNLPPLDYRTEQRLDHISITEAEVLKIPSDIDTSKATGPDLINPRLLFHGRHIITPFLTNLINRSLIQGKVPTQWKLAHVIPIHKKGDKSIPSNYRPISLLSCISKVMERAVFSHMYNHLCNYITPHQSGFLPNHSTVTQLLEICHAISDALDNRKEVFFIFFDISKAFDRVWHRGLLLKLQQLGITGSVYDWIKSYLHNRSQQVVLRSEQSAPLSIKAGVPQGSVLGPLLFLVYINDLPTHITSNLKMFADDTSLFVASENLEQNIVQISKDLDEVTNWADRWLVDFNPAKTISLLISRLHTPANINLSMNNHPITKITAHKHLGVILNSRGNWTDHVNYIIENVNKKINMLKGVKYKINRKCLEIMYKSFIRPSLEYADIIWDNLLQNDIERLEKIQKQALRIITGITVSAPLEMLYLESGFQPLTERRKGHRLAQLFKIINGESPPQLQNLLPPLTSERSAYNTRNRNAFTPYSMNTESYKGSYFPRTVSEWSELPLSTQNAATIAQFKSKLTKNTSPPKWYYYGERKYNIILCQMRNACSALNDDLFNNFVLNNPTCFCNQASETAEHYFFYCPKYNATKEILLQNIHQVSPTLEITIQLLLFGDHNLPIEQNMQVVKAVCNFIKATQRFK